MAFAALLATADGSVLAHLGETVQYTVTAGAAVPVRGIFDAAYVRVEAGDPGVSSSGPAVFFRLEDLPSDPEADEGALVTVNGSVYRVTECQKDGQGGVLLLLHET